jgi:hypothetical protein
MVAHTKKSRNIRHKTLKNRDIQVEEDTSKIVGGVFGFRDSEKAKKELPTFESFFKLEIKEGNERPLYEIQYVKDPSKKYNDWKTGVIMSGFERKNFLSLGNAYFFCKGEHIMTDFSNGLIPIDLSNIPSLIDASYHDLKYIAFELIDHIKFKGKDSSSGNNKEAKTHIFETDGRYFAIIFESDDCPPTMSKELIDKHPECNNQENSYYFSHFIIKEVSKTLADIKGRFARGNRLNTLEKATKRLLGADSYRMIFKNETFYDFFSEDFFKKNKGFRGCKDKSSALCSQLNDINSNFTATTSSYEKFEASDFIDINYLRLLFLLKYQYTKAVDYGRLNMLCDIFALFKQEIIAKDTTGEFKKKISESIGLQFFHFFSNNGGFIKFILESLSKFINGGLRNGFFRDVRLSKKEIEAISQLEKEEELIKKTGDESAIAVAVASTIKGGAIKPNVLKKIVGGTQSDAFQDNIKKPGDRFEKVKDITSIRLGRLGTFSLETDKNYFLKLLNKYININEFDDMETDPTKLIYENDIQNMLIGGLISFLIEMFKRNREGEKRELFIKNLKEILDKYYEHKDDDIIDQIQKLSEKAPPPPPPLNNTNNSESAIAVAVAASSVLKGGNPVSTDANIELSAPEVDSIEYITTNASYYKDKKAAIESFKTILKGHYNGKNTKPMKKHSLYMAYDFHDIVEYFGYKNSKDAKGDQNRPPIDILSIIEIRNVIDKSFYFQYVLMIKQWIIDLKKTQPIEKIVDFMTNIIECIILGSHLICSSGWGLVGLINMIIPIGIGVAAQLLDPRCLQSGALIVRTVMAEWMTETEIRKFVADKKNGDIAAKAERKAIEDAKQADIKQEETKQEEAKTPLHYIQFDPNFQLTFLYTREKDADDKYIYNKFQINADSTVETTSMETIKIENIVDYLQHGKVEIA